MGFLIYVFVLLLLVAFLFIITNVVPIAYAFLSTAFERFGGWLIALLGMGVLVFGTLGFLNKEGRSLRTLPVVFYETVQLFFLNASPDGVNNATTEETRKCERPLRRKLRHSKPADDTSADALSANSDVNKAKSKPRRREETSADAKTKESPPVSDAGNDELRWACLCAAGFVSFLTLGAVIRLYHESFQSALLLLAVDHVVICGYGRIGRQVVTSFLANRGPERRRSRRRQIVIIDNSMSEVDKEWTLSKGLLVIHGDATSSAVLKKAHVSVAREIFVTTGVDEENIEIASKIQTLAGEFQLSRNPYSRFLRWIDKHRDRETEVFVHILDQDIADIARRRLTQANICFTKNEIVHRVSMPLQPDQSSSAVELSSTQNAIHDANIGRDDKSRKPKQSDGIATRFRIFNALERTTRLLLEEIAKRRRTLIPTSDQVSHLVVFGFGEFGQSIVKQLAEQAHFENDRRLRITILDESIESKSKAFLAKQSSFSSLQTRSNPFWFTDDEDSWHYRNDQFLPSVTTQDDPAIRYVCNVGFAEYTDVVDHEMLEKMKNAFRENVKPIILVCFQDGNKNFSCGERLKAKLVTEEINCEVFVWLADREELMSLTAEKLNVLRPIPFGLCAKSVSHHEITDCWTEWLAKWINYAFEQLYAEPKSQAWESLQGYFEKLREGNDPAPELDSVESAYPEVLNQIEKSWDELSTKFPDQSEDFRHSNRSAAIHAVVKLAKVGLAITGHRTEVNIPRLSGKLRSKIQELEGNENDKISRMEHNRWLAERLLRGWKYNATKSNLKKHRPTIVPWEEIAPSEKDKDHASIQILVDLCRFGALVLKDLDSEEIKMDCK